MLSRRVLDNCNLRLGYIYNNRSRRVTPRRLNKHLSNSTWRVYAQCWINNVVDVANATGPGLIGAPRFDKCCRAEEIGPVYW